MVPVRAQTKNVSSLRLDGLFGHSSRFPGAKVEGVKNGSWSCCVWRYFT
jgi:hypothetical protein